MTIGHAETRPVLDAVGASVRRRQTAGGLTQETLAEKAGPDPNCISGIERGTRKPGVKNVVRLARALGVTSAKLVEGLD